MTTFDDEKVIMGLKCSEMGKGRENWIDQICNKVCSQKHQKGTYGTPRNVIGESKGKICTHFNSEFEKNIGNIFNNTASGINWTISDTGIITSITTQQLSHSLDRWSGVGRK